MMDAFLNTTGTLQATAGCCRLTVRTGAIAARPIRIGDMSNASAADLGILRRGRPERLDA